MDPCQFMSRNLSLNTEFQNFIIPGSFQELSGTLDIAFNPIKPDGVSQRHTLHLIASHFYMNEENEVSFHEFLS